MEGDVWRLDVDLGEIDEEAEWLLEELHFPAESHLKLVKSCRAE